MNGYVRRFPAPAGYFALIAFTDNDHHGPVTFIEARRVLAFECVIRDRFIRRDGGDWEQWDHNTVYGHVFASPDFGIVGSISAEEAVQTVNERDPVYVVARDSEQLRCCCEALGRNHRGGKFELDAAGNATFAYKARVSA